VVVIGGLHERQARVWLWGSMVSATLRGAEEPVSKRKNGMIGITRKSAGLSTLLWAGAFGLVASLTALAQTMGGQTLVLSGAEEVPPVTTSAMGTATVDIKADRSVTATVTVSGMTATASHIHEAAAGANGPVIVPFAKTGENTFAAPEGAKLTEAQYESYKAGRLYVNVHSARNPGGEVRAQLKGGL
jgi:hypothetical protein